MSLDVALCLSLYGSAIGGHLSLQGMSLMTAVSLLYGVNYLRARYQGLCKVGQQWYRTGRLEECR